MRRREFMLASRPMAPLSASKDVGIRHLKIGIGGSFKVACLAMLEDAAQMDLENLVKVGFIDTDVSQLEDLPQAVKLILNDVRAADLLEAIAEYQERFPGWEILGDLEEKWRALGAAESLPAGLMTRRELGALVLVYVLWRKPSLVRNFLLNSARELHQVTLNDCWKLNSAALRKYRLVVSYLFSSSGGTGSSLAVSMADLQRHLLSTDGGFTSVEFVAHILLPGPMLHRGNDAAAIKANTWAFFLELMQRYYEKLEPLQLGTYIVPRKHRPFLHTYLYDEHNEREQIFTSREQINDAVKEAEKLMTLGPEGQEYQARGVDYHLAFPNIFSSAGCWLLVYPYQQIEDAFALRSGADWTQERPLKQLDRQELEDRISQHVNDFLNRCHGLRDVPELSKNAIGRPLRINLTVVKDRPRNQLAGAIEDVAQRQLEEHKETLVSQVTQQRDRLVAVIKNEVEALLNQPGGLDLTEQFLHKVFELLTQHKQALDAQLDRARNERKRNRQQLEAVQRPSFWQRYSLNRRAAYMKRAQRAKESDLSELRHLARLELVNQLILATQQSQAECFSWRETLTELHTRLNQALADHWRTAETKRSVVEEWVVCRDEIDEMYEEQHDEVLAQAAEGLHLGWDSEENCLMLRYRSRQPSSTPRWRIVSATGIAKHAKHFRRFWANRVDHSVEEILEERGESPEQVLAYLEHKGAPLIKVDDTTQIPAEKTLKILGSETQSYWGGLVGQTGLSIVATGNRHRLSLLSTVHGIDPLTGLMQSKAWKQAYDDAIASGRSPHVFPDEQIDLDLTPSDGFGSENEEETDGST